MSRSSASIPWKDLLLFVAVLIALGWLVALASRSLGYNWQWYRVPSFLFTFEEGQLLPGPLLQGLIFTLQISAVSFLAAFGLGALTAAITLSDSFMGRILSRGYLEAIRNTPLLVQIYLIYFVMGPFIGLGRFESAVFSLALFEGACLSEIFRAGLLSIHRGQREAAHSLGLSRLDTYRFVLVPQAIRRILPPLTGETISLIKNSSLVSLVSLADLSMNARILASDTFLTFEVWFTTAGLYLLITVPLSLTVYTLEKRFKVLS
jgi:polar amino acid transport system permease protein